MVVGLLMLLTATVMTVPAGRIALDILVTNTV